MGEIANRFVYTLEPSLLPDQNSIDAFWFDTQAGFCSHFAGAFVYLMRSVGVEARMVGGYQGGAINPITGHLVVRQYDAHAWAEYFDPDQGWIRVDPTGAVAPERIRAGLNAALSAEDRDRLSAFTNARLGALGGVTRLLHMFDSVQHRWNLWVVGYDTNLQMDYLTRLLGKKPTTAQIGAMVLFGGFLTMGIAAMVLFLRRPARPKNPLIGAFTRFAKAAESRGLVREAWESPMAFVRRVATHNNLPQADVDAAIEGLEAQLYRLPAGETGESRKPLMRVLRRLRLRTMLQP